MQWVFLLGKSKGDDLNNDKLWNAATRLVTEPKYLDSGPLSLILHENALVPGNVQAMKALLARSTDKFGEAGDPYKAIRLAHKAWERRLPVTPLAYRTPSSSGDGRPSFRCGAALPLRAWKLLWPPLGVMNIPNALIRLLQAFLSNFDHDIVPLNLAVAATIIYFDMERRKWDPELTDSKMVTGVQPAKAPLAQFVLYFPHLLRFTEVAKLSRYPYPLRFVGHWYAEDLYRNGAFGIPDINLNEWRARQLVQNVQMRAAGVSVDHRFHLLPASMPGSETKWSLWVKDAKEPSRSLNGLCLLNDNSNGGAPQLLWARKCNAGCGGALKVVVCLETHYRQILPGSSLPA
ncbi:hypothetical protein QQZ08_009968 [Neonectria magnoliae]|uniref:Uncharacterized protein n=1 Tax=Neonectria magnoliae TaxID=2732573 RepID=A0ABR1HL31_9HYPO